MSSILKSKLKVALIQLAGSHPDKSKNLSRAAQFVAKAMTEQPDTKLVVLPECFNSPYAVDKFREYAEVISIESPSVKALSDIARQWKITLVGGSIPELEPESDKIYNTSVVFNEMGEIIGTHRKAHLFDIDIPGGITFKESTTLSGGDKNTIIDAADYGKFGLGICYDMRFPELAMISARKGAFAMIYPSAFNTTTGPMHWHLLARSRSIDNEIYTLLCSPARNMDASYHAYGHSVVVNPRGEIIAEAGEGEEIIYAELDPESIDNTRQAIPVTFQRRFDIYADISKIDP